MKIDLPIGGVDFGDACVGCGAAPTAVHEIEAKSGIDLLLVSFAHVVELKAPACAACAGRRRGVYWGIAVGLLAAIVAMVGVVSTTFVPRYGEAAMGVLALPVVLALLWARNQLDAFADRRGFGVCGVAVDKGRDSVTLWFRDEKLGAAVAARAKDAPRVESTWETEIHPH